MWVHLGVFMCVCACTLQLESHLLADCLICNLWHQYVFTSCSTCFSCDERLAYLQQDMDFLFSLFELEGIVAYCLMSINLARWGREGWAGMGVMFLNFQSYTWAKCFSIFNLISKKQTNKKTKLAFLGSDHPGFIWMFSCSNVEEIHTRKHFAFILQLSCNYNEWV